MQNQRAVLFLILAVALGVGAAFTAQRWLEQQRQRPSAEQATTQPVAVMREALQVGRSSITGARDRGLADRLPAGGRSLGSREARGSRGAPAARGGRARARIGAAARGITRGPGLGDRPAQRAISVHVDPVVGVAGFVVPGSRVDVLVTILRVDADNHPVQQGDPPGRRGARDRPEARGGQRGRARAGAGRDARATPQQAERLTHAAHQGRLQLALRNPSDHEVVATHGVNATEVLNERKAAAPRMASRPEHALRVERRSHQGIAGFGAELLKPCRVESVHYPLVESST